MRTEKAVHWGGLFCARERFSQVKELASHVLYRRKTAASRCIPSLAKSPKTVSVGGSPGRRATSLWARPRDCEGRLGLAEDMPHEIGVRGELDLVADLQRGGATGGRLEVDNHGSFAILDDEVGNPHQGDLQVFAG